MGGESNIIKNASLRLLNEPKLIGEKKENKNNDVKINLKRENGLVKIIEVTCSCGNKIQLICEYESFKD